MKTKVKGTSGYKATDIEQDGIGLLLIIHNIMCRIEQHMQHTWGLVAVNKALCAEY